MHDATGSPRSDAASPAWYPDPRRPGALRYWNGATWVEADATRGWYPDPEGSPVLRLWTGSAWGEVLGPPTLRSAEPTHVVGPRTDPPIDPSQPVAGAAALPSTPIPAVAPDPRRAEAAASSRWVTAVLVASALVAGAVLGGVVVASTSEQPAPATAGGTPSGGPATEGRPDVADEADEAVAAQGSGSSTRFTVTRVLSARSLELAGAAGTLEVRLLGLDETPCDTNSQGKDLLKSQALGQEVLLSTITDPVTTDVGAYVDLDGEDVGELLIRAGLAVAAVGHPRAPAYARAQAAVSPVCPAGPGSAPPDRG